MRKQNFRGKKQSWDVVKSSRSNEGRFGGAHLRGLSPQLLDGGTDLLLEDTKGGKIREIRGQGV